MTPQPAIDERAGKKRNAHLLEHIVDLELAFPLLGELVETLAQEDILLGDVGEDKSHLSLVVGVASNLFDDLQHRGDTRTYQEHKRVNEFALSH